MLFITRADKKKKKIIVLRIVRRVLLFPLFIEILTHVLVFRPRGIFFSLSLTFQ